MVEQPSSGPLKDTRSRIIAAAIILFGEQGYAGTSVRDISERLGVTKAALYYHFPSKETILDALLAPLITELGQLLSLVRQAPPPDPAVLLDRMAEVMAGPGGVLIAFINDPSVIRRKIGEADVSTQQREIVHALAGPEPTTERLLRAHCALGAIKSGILGRVMERRGSVEERRGSVEEPAGPCAELAGPVRSALLRTVAVRGVQAMQPLVTPAERRVIVAAALAALGAAEPTVRRIPTTGMCVESGKPVGLAAVTRDHGAQ